MHYVQDILNRAFGVDDWQVEKPKDGMQKECYIAHGSQRSIFLKFDVHANILQRLGDIGVAPRVLSSGHHDGRSFVMQEYITGTHPTRDWLKDHMEDAGALIRTYHEDALLRKLLVNVHEPAYDQHIRDDLHWLAGRIDAHRNPKLHDMFNLLRSIAGSFPAVSLVPVHNEPNLKNMLVSSNRLFFIDWDEAALSDPLRDIGVFSWWYLPAGRWTSFFATCGMSLTEMQRRKAYWFAARASLVIYLWRLEHGYSDGGFLEDFKAALHMDSNPHRT